MLLRGIEPLLFQSHSPVSLPAWKLAERAWLWALNPSQLPHNNERFEERVSELDHWNPVTLNPGLRNSLYIHLHSFASPVVYQTLAKNKARLPFWYELMQHCWPHKFQANHYRTRFLDVLRTAEGPHARVLADWLVQALRLFLTGQHSATAYLTAFKGYNPLCHLLWLKLEPLPADQILGLFELLVQTNAEMVVLVMRCALFYTIRVDPTTHLWLCENTRWEQWFEKPLLRCWAAARVRVHRSFNNKRNALHHCWSVLSGWKVLRQYVRTTNDHQAELFAPHQFFLYLDQKLKCYTEFPRSVRDCDVGLSQVFTDMPLLGADPHTPQEEQEWASLHRTENGKKDYVAERRVLSLLLPSWGATPFGVTLIRHLHYLYHRRGCTHQCEEDRVWRLLYHHDVHTLYLCRWLAKHYAFFCSERLVTLANPFHQRQLKAVCQRFQACHIPPPPNFDVMAYCRFCSDANKICSMTLRLPKRAKNNNKKRPDNITGDSINGLTNVRVGTDDGLLYCKSCNKTGRYSVLCQTTPIKQQHLALKLYYCFNAAFYLCPLCGTLATFQPRTFNPIGPHRLPIVSETYGYVCERCRLLCTTPTLQSPYSS